MINSENPRLPVLRHVRGQGHLESILTLSCTNLALEVLHER
ncbi:hypothetical protein [Pseudomonas sp. GW101-3H06]|nr:hypothetical protein [Pseudomonas sp. GW101-3H06]